jgi:hypothetical protein
MNSYIYTYSKMATCLNKQNTEVSNALLDILLKYRETEGMVDTRSNKQVIQVTEQQCSAMAVLHKSDWVCTKSIIVHWTLDTTTTYNSRAAMRCYVVTAGCIMNRVGMHKRQQTYWNISKDRNLKSHVDARRPRTYDIIFSSKYLRI